MFLEQPVTPSHVAQFKEPFCIVRTIHETVLNGQKWSAHYLHAMPSYNGILVVITTIQNNNFTILCFHPPFYTFQTWHAQCSHPHSCQMATHSWHCTMPLQLQVLFCHSHELVIQLVVPRASATSGEHSEFWVTTMHTEPLRKSTHFLHQYTSPFTMLPSVLFYKEGLYIFT